MVERGICQSPPQLHRRLYETGCSLFDQVTWVRDETLASFEGVPELWLRCEYQTLRRLPDTGGVLFTIKTQQCDVDRLRLEDGDRLLLCSDGLSDLVDDEMMTRTLLGAPASSDACAQLVQMALDSGGRDNVTVIVASYTFPEQS